MATSNQKDALVSQLDEVLGISNVDFSKFNYKVTKPINVALAILKDRIKSVSLRVMRLDHSTGVKGRTILFTLEVMGDFSKLNKPQKRHLRTVDSCQLSDDKLTILIGSQHCGFAGLILAAEIIRYASQNGITIIRTSQNAQQSIHLIRDQCIIGVPPVLTQWTKTEIFYLLREAGIGTRYIDGLADTEDEVVKFELTSPDSDILNIEIRGAINISDCIRLRVEDSIVKGFITDRYDMEVLTKLLTWLYIRGKNINDIYHQALREYGQRLENTEEKKQEKIAQLIKEISATSSRGVAYPGLKDRSLADLDVLVKQYVQLRGI